MHRVRKTAGWLLLPLAAASYPSQAQVQITAQPVAPYPGVPYQGQPAAEGAGSELSRYLTMLAGNPNSVVALTGAGRAALELGDAEAALTFYGRAEELSPQDGTIKAGIGSAMVLMEQPETALQFFYEAVRLGVPAIEMAAYRGLAYDLTGDPPRAQQDYQLALRRRDDPEVRRRLALSLGIIGQRDAALATIDYQLRRQDRAAWRVRAFVLALTGDAQGAMQVVRSMMPYQAAEMAPFLARLPTLSVTDRARAVHFGHFPGAPTAAAATGVGGPPTDPVTSAGRPDTGQRPLGPPLAAAPAAPPNPVPAATAPIVPPSVPRVVASAEPVALAPRPALPAPPLTIQASPPSSPVTAQPPPASLAPGFSTQAPPALAPKADATPPSIAKVGPNQPPPLTRNLADVATVIARLSDPPAAKAAPAKPAAAVARKEPAVPKEPSRKWVQVSLGRSESALSGEYRRIKAKAPKLFTGKTAWLADNGESNRLLVGPFKSNKEAQDFVNQLAEADLSSFSWTSATGQEIKKLPTK